MGQIFKQAEKYLDHIDQGRWVEIGSSRRGDDGSTLVISQWATGQNQRLDTIDFDPLVCAAMAHLDLKNTNIINQTGEEYLKRSKEQISFLYLDNFDWDWHPLHTESWVLNQIERYDKLGFTMNNVNCQAVHLQQAILAADCMTDKALVICDDTWFVPGWGVWCGKSGAAVPYLISQGFRVLEHEEHPVYGVILGKGF